MDEVKLIEKLKLIEALFAGATTQGEKHAAENALERIKHRLQKVQVEDPPTEYKFTLNNMWSKKLFMALLRRYGIKPYRYHRQRYTTVMAVVSQTFVDETLWPQFQELDKVLEDYLGEVTDRVISESIHGDSSDADVVKQIGKS